MEHLNSSLSGLTSSIPASAPYCADDPSTYTDQISVYLFPPVGHCLLVPTAALFPKAFEKYILPQNQQVFGPL